MPNEDSQGKLHPMRCLKRSIFSSGAREITANEVSRAVRCTIAPAKLSATKEQLLHPSSHAGSNMKW